MNETMSKKELRKRRKALENEVFSAIKDEMKGTAWRKKSNSLFREKAGYFFAAYIGLANNIELADKGQFFYAKVVAKPMDIDPLFWDIFKLPDNKTKPLSFRAWAAFCCEGIKIGETETNADNEAPDVIARRLINQIENVTESYINEVKSISFSKQLKESDAQKKRGQLAISLVTTLIAEGEIKEARDLASRYNNGELHSNVSFVSDDRGFHSFALEWIDKNYHL